MFCLICNVFEFQLVVNSEKLGNFSMKLMGFWILGGRLENPGATGLPSHCLEQSGRAVAALFRLGLCTYQSMQFPSFLPVIHLACFTHFCYLPESCRYIICISASASSCIDDSKLIKMFFFDCDLLSNFLIHIFCNSLFFP